MKKITTLFVLLMILFINKNCFSQAPNWQWAKASGGYDFDHFGGSVTDAYGNVYITGEFISPVMYTGADSLINVNYPNSIEMYVIKYDTYGNVIWAKSAGGNYFEYVSANSVAVDSLGNVFVAGVSNDTIAFDTVTLSGSGGIFIVKYDINGNALWAKNPFTPISNYDEVTSLVTDASGNIYVTGKFTGSSITVGSYTLNNTGGSDIFVSKYDTNGNVIWAKNAGGTNEEKAYCVYTDARNNVYLTGSFKSSTLAFGSSTLTNTGKTDMFVLKYDNNGNPLWAKSAMGDSAEWGNSVKADANGNVYVTGTFFSPSATFGSIALANSGYSNMFLVKYDSLGNVLWANTGVGTGPIYGNSVTTDNWGYVYATGTIYSTSMVFGSYTLTGTDTGYAYIVKYNPAGILSWVKGVTNCKGMSITTDAFGNPYLAGEFSVASVPLDSSILINNQNAGDISDMYVAKLNATTGITQINNPQSTINISPNPFTSQTTITFGSTGSPTEHTIKIMNVLGECIQQLITNGSTSSVTIDMNGFAKGIYFVKIQTEKGITNRKIVLQ